LKINFKSVNSAKLGFELSQEFGEANFDKADVTNPMFLYPNCGYGDITNSYCDNFSSHYICDRVDLHELIGQKLGKDYKNKMFIRNIHFNCGKWTCPACYLRVALRQAGKVETRLKAMSKILRETDLAGSKVEHIVVSLPKADYEILDEKVLRAKMIKALNDLGITDGALLFHGSRHRKYEWIKGVVFRQIGTDWSPHGHFLGVVPKGYKCRDCKRKSNCLAGCGGFDDRRWQYFQKTGIYVKIMYEKRKSVFWTASYQLNHISVKRDAKRVHTVTYIGACSTRKLHVEVEKRKLVCPICKYELRRAVYVGKEIFVTDRASPDYVGCFLADYKETDWIDAPKHSFIAKPVGVEPRYGSMEWLRSVRKRSYGSYG